MAAEGRCVYRAEDRLRDNVFKGFCSGLCEYVCRTADKIKVEYVFLFKRSLVRLCNGLGLHY